MRTFELEKKTTRDTFGKALFALAKQDDSIIGLGADTTNNLGMKAMSQEMPERVINVGIAEQNMMGIAAGLAATGFHVFCGSFAPFVSMRCLEQFRTFVAYPHLNVKVASGMAGLSAGNEGVTHQCYEDLTIMRAIPGNVVLYPADNAATEAMVKALGAYEGPAYIRLGKLPFYKVFDENYHFEIGKANLLEDGGDLTIICCGTAVYRCLQAKDLLAEEGISARVLEMPCIKPLDTEAVLCAAEETGAIITVEEANILGGLGGAVAEVLAENCAVPFKRVGMNDCFAESGNHYQLMDKYGLSLDDIVGAAKCVYAKKSNGK